MNKNTPTAEIECKKRTCAPVISQHSSLTHSPPTIPKFMQDFGVMVCDIAQILQRHEGALERMLITFEHMVIPMKSATYTTLVNSKEYSSINSVRAFFKLLAPYWKPVHCPLLIALVNATECEAAIERLEAYLTGRQKVGGKVGLGEEGENTNVPLPNPVTALELQESSQNGSHPYKESTNTTTSTSNATNLSSPHSVESAASHDPVPPGQPPAIVSQPTANMDSLQVSAKVAQDRVTWAEYDRKTSLLCGVLRIPSFMLQYIGFKPGSVVIKWVTSDGLLPYILSNMMDDGDLQLLLQENIVSIQVGSEYTITVGSVEYWKVSMYIQLAVQCKGSCKYRVW